MEEKKMNAWGAFLVMLGALDIAVAAVIGPWYLVYKIREWGCKE
jgi:hypothetical protein